MGDSVYAVILREGKWIVANILVTELKERMTLGSCAVYDLEWRKVLSSIAILQNTLDNLRK